MKDGERLVWAAAFAGHLASVDRSSNDKFCEGLCQASVVAYTAVLGLRKLSESSMSQSLQHEGWDMVRAMAGITRAELEQGRKVS